MKNMKRVLSALLACVLVLGAAFSASPLTGINSVEAAMTELDANVSSIQLLRNNGNPDTDPNGDSWLVFQLNPCDYGSTFLAGTVTGGASWFEDYGTLDKIWIYTEGKTEPDALSSMLAATGDTNVYYNFFLANSMGFNITDAYDGKTVTKVVIEKGAVFPTFTNKTSKVYVTQKEAVFTSTYKQSYYNAGNWVCEYVNKTATSVTAIQTRPNTATDKRLFFKLGTCDYPSGTFNIDLSAANASWKDQYNTLDMIDIYAGNDTPISLRTLYQNAAMNLWGDANMFCLGIGGSYDGQNITKVVIKEGCEFPSYAFEVAHTTTEKQVYVVEQETIFTSTSQTDALNHANWNRKVVTPTQNTNSGVSALHIWDPSGKLIITPTVHDYTGVAGNTPISGDMLSRLQEYNLFEKITVSTATESKTLAQLTATNEFYLNLWGTTGLAIDMLDTFNGTTVKTIEIAEGCEFPSYDYLKNGGTKRTCYITTENYTYTTNTSAANNSDWILVDNSVPYDTEVKAVITGHNGNQVAFHLSANDYTVGTQQFTSFGTKQEEYNFLDQIEIHTKTDGVKTLRTLYNPANSWYQMWGVADTVSIDLTIADDQIEKIVVPKDTVFPSFAYVSGNNTKRFGYITTAEKVFYNEEDTIVTDPFEGLNGDGSYAWAQQTPVIDMMLSKNIAHPEALTFTTSKIATPGATDPEHSFTAVDSTAVFTYNGVPSASVPRMNMFGLYTDVKEMTANAKDRAEIGDTIVLGGLWKYAGDNKQYNIQTVTYKWSGSTWIEYTTPMNLTLTKHIAHAGALTFQTNLISILGASDPEQSFATMDASSVFTYNGTPSASTPRMNQFGLYTDVKEMTANAQASAAIGDEIVLGGLWSYAGDGKTYVIQTVKYTWDGSTWTSSDLLEWVDTDIANIQVRSVNDVLLVFPTVHDYAGTGSTIAINNMDATYATLKNITVYKSDTEYKTLAELVTMEGSTGERYYNIWGENGCFAIDMPNGWGGEEIEKIVFTKGCQFPSYATANGGSAKKIIYRLQDDVIFVSRTPAEDNISWERTFASTPIETVVTGVQVMGTDGNVRLVVSLETNDYDGAEDSYDISTKYADYNTLKNIVLYADGTPTSLEDIVSGDEVFLNLWGTAGTISFALKPEYDLDSFDEATIQAGCEFAAYSYTLPGAQNKIAYTVGSLQKLDITRTSYVVTYYDESGAELFKDTVEAGEAFELRAVPVKAGYVGSWEGLTYTVMPAQNIEYRLSYEKAEVVEETPTEPTEPQEPTEKDEEEKAPVMGDANRLVWWSVLMAGALAVVLVITKRKWNSIGE